MPGRPPSDATTLIPELDNPIELFKTWLNKARESHVHLPESMALATADKQGRPSVRIVLLKDCDENGFVFYTSLKSRKASELDSNPNAALCFHWRDLARQVRVEGVVERVSSSEADAYFASRPRESQLGAWASDQSAEVPAREQLVRRFEKCAKDFQDHDVPRPPFWSGYRVKPFSMEFWQEMPHRLHDRLLYVKDDSGQWKAARLYP